jgi:NADPH-dependent ferric siderophore reductase
LKHSRVTQVTALSSYLVRFDVSGDELRDVKWTPGDKAQILIPGQAVRTYTPFGWRDDSVSFLGFIHGHTPGSNWVRTLRAGDPVDFIGPQKSLSASGITGPVVVVGDETSIAVARAFSESRRVVVVLEAGDVDATREVCAKLGLSNSSIVPRGNLDALATNVKAHVDSGATPFFTGRAATIQQLKQRLQVKGATKAYWADGKRGLD